MPTFACPFRIQRLALAMNVVTPVTPPILCSSVTISNRTLGDVKIHSDATGADYGILSSCFEERIDLAQSGSATALFRPGHINFYLEAALDGDVVLTWT